MIPINNYLIVTALGQQRQDIVSELSRSCLHCGCNLLNTKINVLGENIALILYLSGNWSAIAKMEATLPMLEQRLSLSIHAKRSNEYLPAIQSMSYTLQLVGIDRPGILSGITDFLQKHIVLIDEVSSNTYLSNTSTRMMALHLKINIPDKIHLATLREQFMTYCDDHNLDGFMEPARNS